MKNMHGCKTALLTSHVLRQILVVVIVLVFVLTLDLVLVLVLG